MPPSYAYPPRRGWLVAAALAAAGLTALALYLWGI